MNTDFARIMTLLRKEKKVSQKQAALDLGVSQGLLSHYEKGKRECGLDFLVRAADYYNVSCDYLLGRSPEPEGKTISVEDIPEDDPNHRDRITSKDSIIVSFNKKLVVNSVNVIFALLAKCRSATVIKEASGYLMLSVYKVFRFLWGANPKNDRNFFMIDQTAASSGCDAAMSVASAKLNAATKGVALSGEDTVKDVEELAMDTATLGRVYPQYYSSMVNLIKNSEQRIKSVTESK